MTEDKDLQTLIDKPLRAITLFKKILGSYENALLLWYVATESRIRITTAGGWLDTKEGDIEAAVGLTSEEQRAGRYTLMTKGLIEFKTVSADGVRYVDEEAGRYRLKKDAFSALLL